MIVVQDGRGNVAGSLVGVAPAREAVGHGIEVAVFGMVVGIEEDVGRV